MIVFVHELKGHHNLLQINTRRTIHACFKLHTMRKKSFLAHCTRTPCTQNCNNSCLLTNELQRIAEFASWNGYPRHLANKLIKLFSPKDNDNARANLISQPNKQVLSTIWIHLQYIGKKEMPLIKSYTKKISHLLKSPSKFTTTYPTYTYILIILIHSLDILPFVYIAHNKVPKVGVLPIAPEQD